MTADIYRQIKTFITLHTSTSFTECDSIPLLELIDFFDDVLTFIEEKNKVQTALAP